MTKPTTQGTPPTPLEAADIVLWKEGKAYRIGDLIELPVTFYRKWWQFWKPKNWTEKRIMPVLAVGGFGEG